MVTGGRDWTDSEMIERDLLHIAGEADGLCESVTLIEGGAEGADRIAKRFALGVLGWRIETFKAEWDKYGKGAGPIRNQEMVDSKPDRYLAYPTARSVGTLDAVRRLVRAGVPGITREVTP